MFSHFYMVCKPEGDQLTETFLIKISVTMQNVFMCFCNLTRKTDWLIDLDVRSTTYFFSFMHCSRNKFRVQGWTESTNCNSLIITVILQRCERTITTALSFTSFINGQTIWTKKKKRKRIAQIASWNIFGQRFFCASQREAHRWFKPVQTESLPWHLKKKKQKKKKKHQQI